MDEKPRDPDTLAREAAHALWDLWRLWKQRSRSRCRGRWTFEQHFLLRRIARTGPMTVSQLADELGITPGAATIATRRLEKAGLLTKQRSHPDQRVVMLSLTPEGRASLDELDAMRLDVLTDLLRPLDDTERATLAALMRKVTAGEAERPEPEQGGEEARGGTVTRGSDEHHDHD